MTDHGREAGGGRWSPLRLSRQYPGAILVPLIIVTAVGVVAASPLALDVYGDSGSWVRRSQIGQTYGAAAALFSVFALVGIGMSLILQAREAKIGREQASRGTHTELLRMAIDDPVYRECWGQADDSAGEDELRQHIYTNLIVSYWQSRYELGTLSVAHVRAAAADMFSALPGRRFWSAVREVRHRTSQGRRARQFHRILDEEYEKAVAAGPSRGAVPRGRRVLRRPRPPIPEPPRPYPPWPMGRSAG